MNNASGMTSGPSSTIRGAYARRLIDTTFIPGGLRARVALIPYLDLGDERHPIIVSAEPLRKQMLTTNTPNRPPENTDALLTRIDSDSPLAADALLEVQALAPRIVRVRLGSEDSLAQSRDFGMIVPGALEALTPLAIDARQGSTSDIAVALGDITLCLRRDPLAINIACTELPAATDEALAIFRRYAKLRTCLNPYLYATAWEAHAHGWPMLRPLVLEFPGDPIAAQIDDAYLLGARLLVAPVFSESRAPVARNLYLPAGEWIDFWTGERIAGGAYITRVCELDTIPLYVRAGTILPLGPQRPYIGDEIPDELTVDVYTGAEGMAQVVWDASGNASRLRLQRSRGGWKLDIGGDRVVTWSVRWHTGAGIVETGPSRAASASFRYA
jgi:hypothetical protein